MDDPVLIERDGRVAIVTLNRPAKLNTLSIALRQLFVRTLRELDADDEVGAIVLTGAGERAFCAGMDLTEVNVDWPRGPEIDTYLAVINCQTPIVAAVNGLCLTGGLEIMVCCDMSLAASHARFADTHVRVGLLPGTSGITQRLSRAIGPQRAKEMQLTGNYVDAAQAYDWGLVNRVVEPEALMPAALKLAHDLADGRYAAMMAYKRIIDEGYEIEYGEAVKLEFRRSEEFRETVHPDDLALSKQATFARGRVQSGA